MAFRRFVSCWLAGFVLIAMVMPGWIVADIDVTGGVTPPYNGTSDPWVVDSELIVGYQADGSLSITLGSDVTPSDVVFIGDYDAQYSGTTGTLLLTGSGSTLNVDSAGESELFIGPLAAGYLTVGDSAILTSHDALIGGSPVFDAFDQVIGVAAGEGHAIVTGGAQWSTGDWGWLTVGAVGFGELTIEGSGSSVTGSTSEIGLMPDAVGQVLVDQSSSWSLTQELVVGVWGDGSLTISGGGQVQSGRSWVGGVDADVMDYNEPIFDGLGEPNGTGHVVVTGEGSQWNAGSMLTVGSWGTGDVKIQDGGQVTAEEAFIGGMPITLGEGQEFSQDLVPDGTGTVTVTGTGSLLQVTSDDTLYVGYSSNGVLDVNEGGQVVSNGIVIGGSPDAVGTVTVHDAGSQIVTDEELLVGAWGEGNVTVSDGGEVQAGHLNVGGFDPENTGLDPAVLAAFGDPEGTGTVLVTGEDSLLDVASVARIGYSGDAFVDVNDGGTINASQVVMGILPGSQAEVTVDGTGSLLQISHSEQFENDTGLSSGAIGVGGYGEATLTVSSGGHVTAAQDLTIGGFDFDAFDHSAPDQGYDPNGTGTVTVTGDGSLVEAVGIGVGIGGDGTLDILNGGRVESQIGVVGVGEWGTGRVTVDGEGSTWRLSGDGAIPDGLSVNGDGGLVISNGGLVEVDGSNAALIVADTTTVGSEGEGTLTVAGGGLVASGAVVIGGTNPNFDTLAEYMDPNAGLGTGTGAVTVRGDGSLMQAEEVHVGFSGEGTLTIEAGGRVEDDAGWIGVMPDVVGTALVTGENSVWDNNANLVVGAWGQGDLTIADGAQVSAPEVYVGGTSFDLLHTDYDPNLIPDGTGTVLVTGAGSQLDVTSEDTMYVGYFGTGTLDVNDGGNVTAGTVVLGAAPGAVGTVEVTDAGSTLTTEDIQVGAWGTGDLTVSGGASATTSYLAIGGVDVTDTGLPQAMLDDFGPSLGTGTVTVTGEGSTLLAESFLAGVTGEGTVQVADGGQFTAELGVVGLGEGSTGTVTVTGEGSTLTLEAVGEEGFDYGVLAVGGWGTGQVTISDGGLVEASRVNIGGFYEGELTNREGDSSDWGDGDPAGMGTVLVTGEGSRLNVNGDIALTVGYSGEGILTASEGGRVETNNLMVGGGPGATGTVTIDDAELSVNGDAMVGGWGQGNLTVSNGGQAEANALLIGGFDESQAPGDLAELFGDALGTGTVAVTGDSSVFDVTENDGVLVGYSGDGTLEILNGGQVNSHAGIVGVLEGATGFVSVDGEGSTWQITGGETLPDLTAEGDGEVIVSRGGAILVDGTNGLLDVAGRLTVGSEGDDNSLAISNGGQVYSDTGVIGGFDPQFEDIADYFNPGMVLSEGTGEATVTGEGSRWETGDLHVGFSGDGSLSIEDGGYVLDELGMIGVMEGFTGTAEVTGADSIWDNLSDLVVGAWGTGDLIISAGGTVYATDAYIGGMPLNVVGAEDDPDYTPTGTGTVTVTGGNSELIVSAPASLYVGYSGDGTLNVLEAGYVQSETGGIAALPGSTGSASIDGDESEWDNTMSMFVGGYGTGNLTVRAGGLMDVHDNLYIGGFDADEFSIDVESIGYDPNGTGAVTVTGEGSTLYGTGLEELYVGYSGHGTMDVNDGGYVESGIAAVGLLPGSTGEVTVDGASPGEGGDPSTWDNIGSMAIGGYGAGSLTIGGGAEVYVGDTLYIGGFNPEYVSFSTIEGSDPNGTGEVTVTGNYSLLAVGGNDTLYVGYNGTGTLNVLAGGSVESQESTLGYEEGGLGVVNVTGPWSTWVASEQSIGRTGQGSLTISDGGLATTNSAILGQMVGGSGEVLVTGANSQWLVYNTLWVGYRGEGLLTIADGAQVSSPNGILGEEETANGTVVVTGESSEWDLGNDLYIGYAGTGTVDVNDGGTLVVDESLYVGGGNEGSGGTGTLMVNDTGEVLIGEELTVWETGTLGGDGTITIYTPTTLHNYGTIAPGDDGIGTLTVEGNVVFHEDSTYAVQINNSSSDKLVVDGDVTIEGGTVQVDSEGTILGEHEYEIIQASSVTGEFDELDTALLDFSFTDIGLDYNDVSVWLYVTAANFNDPNITRTHNQQQVGGALQVIADEGGNDITDDLQQLSTPDDVRHAYDQLSGQTRSQVAPLTVANTSKFLGMVTSRVQTVQTGLVNAFGGQGLYAMAGPDASVGDGRMVDVSPQGQTFAVGRSSSTLGDRKWGLWGRGYGLYGDRESENGMPGYSYDAYGGSFGADYQLTDTFLAGIVGGLSEGDVDFAASRDNTDFDAMHIGLYGSLAWTGWYLDYVVTYADLEYDTERFVDLTSERLTGTFDGHELAGYVETGLNWDLAPDLKLQPLASLQYTYLDLDSYTETGGASALAFEGQTFESVKGGLGARLTHRLIESAGDFRADVQLRGRWIHEFGDTRSSVDSSFLSDPTVVFNIRDEDVSRDSAILGVGFTAMTSKHTRAYVDFDTRLNRDESVHVISAAFQYRW